MKNLFEYSFWNRFLLCALLFSVMAHSKAVAQDMSSLMTEANQAWKEKKYAQSQQALTRIVKIHGPRAKILHGPKFGVIYYRKGLTELKLAHEASKRGDRDESRKWYAEAVQSFRICYEEYPNHEGN